MAFLFLKKCVAINLLEEKRKIHIYNNCLEKRERDKYIVCGLMEFIHIYLDVVGIIINIIFKYIEQIKKMFLTFHQIQTKQFATFFLILLLFFEKCNEPKIFIYFLRI